jgi:hypothetical protein
MSFEPALRIGVTYGPPQWGPGAPVPSILRGSLGSGGPLLVCLSLRPSGAPQTHSKSRALIRRHFGLLLSAARAIHSRELMRD